MAPLIEEKRSQLLELCRRFQVRRLEVFGSAAGDRFDPQRSDVDFLVEFEPLPFGRHADCYLGLLVALEDLMDRPIDLVAEDSIRNPYFRQEVDATRKLVYADGREKATPGHPAGLPEN